jgi:hypothetical protein
MKAKWWHRLWTVSPARIKRIVASLLLGASSSYATPSPAPKPPLIPDRVAAVRSALSEKGSVLSGPKNDHAVKAPEKLAQWGNFPNWGNWGNFNNWNNWGNWSNWSNWRNF